jgi:hypothetical protein
MKELRLMETTCMKSLAARVPLLLTAMILFSAAVLLATSRLEYCGQPEALQPRAEVAVAAKTQWPTLAPPQKTVFVRVEVDKPDLEVGWATN